MDYAISITANEFKARQGDFFLLDVREPNEHETEHLENSALIPLGTLEASIDKIPKEKPTLVYCAVGQRSLNAAKILRAKGLEAQSLEGGIEAWREIGGETIGGDLSTAEIKRFGRQILLPEIGPSGQRAIGAGRVLVIGAGGLGSPSLLYLAAAGIGKIGIVDDDVVEESNLQRQIVHNTKSIGKKKTSSAHKMLNELNPHTEVVEFQTRLGPSNAREIISGFDLVIDGADNFPTRYLINDIAVRLDIPVVSASILGFEGQITTFVPGEGPCYRCLYPMPPPPSLAPSCTVGGILGSVAGTLGILQAGEALKIIGGFGRPLIGKLLLFQALDTEWTKLKITRDPLCPVCQSPESLDAPLPDYEDFCNYNTLVSA